jgi:hypothetical protein
MRKSNRAEAIGNQERAREGAIPIIGAFMGVYEDITARR